MMKRIPMMTLSSKNGLSSLNNSAKKSRIRLMRPMKKARRRIFGGFEILKCVFIGIYKRERERSAYI
jgi:hypothetical protein